MVAAVKNLFDRICEELKDDRRSLKKLHAVVIGEVNDGGGAPDRMERLYKGYCFTKVQHRVICRGLVT